MEHFHTTDSDLPTSTAKQDARLDLEDAVARFLASGGNVTHVGSVMYQPATHAARSDEQLLIDLQLKASLGHGITTAARDLGEPLSRCQRLARAHRIPFRNVSTSKSRRAL